MESPGEGQTLTGSTCTNSVQKGALLFLLKEAGVRCLPVQGAPGWKLLSKHLKRALNEAAHSSSEGNSGVKAGLLTTEEAMMNARQRNHRNWGLNKQTAQENTQNRCVRSISSGITTTMSRIKLLKVSENAVLFIIMSLLCRCIKPELKSLALGFYTLTTRTLGKYFTVYKPDYAVSVFLNLH